MTQPDPHRTYAEALTERLGKPDEKRAVLLGVPFREVELTPAGALALAAQLTEAVDQAVHRLPQRPTSAR